jgi:hypothetical protein
MTKNGGRRLRNKPPPNEEAWPVFPTIFCTVACRLREPMFFRTTNWDEVAAGKDGLAPESLHPRGQSETPTAPNKLPGVA